MKKLTFKISRGLKTALIVSSFLGVLACASKYGVKSAVNLAGVGSLAFVGVVGKLKSAGKWDGLDENTKSFLELQDKQAEDLSNTMEALKASKETLETKLKSLEENGTKLNDADDKTLKELQETIKKQAVELDNLKNRAGADDGTGAIAKALKDNDAEIKEFLNGGRKGKVDIEVKASQTASNIATHTIGDYANGIGQIPVRKPFIEDLFPVVNTTKEFIKYMDQESVVRDAKNVAGCAASTHNTKLTWKERTIQITKVRDYVDICQDMMDDYDFVEGELRKLVETSVMLKVDNGLLLDDGIHPNLHSIDEASSEFDHANATAGVWTDSVKDADIFGLVIAMSSQIIALGEDNSYMPDTVLINTIDKYKAMLLKDKNGQYIMPPFVAVVNNKEYTIDGMKVRSNPLVAANTCYVFDSTKGTIYSRKGITIEMSYENNDNFETETVTLKAYRRLNLLIRNVDKNAFMKCSDITTAIAAIEEGA